MHFGSTFLSRLRMMLWVFGLDFIGYYFLSSIIIFKVQGESALYAMLQRKPE